MKDRSLHVASVALIALASGLVTFGVAGCSSESASPPAANKAKTAVKRSPSASKGSAKTTAADAKAAKQTVSGSATTNKVSASRESELSDGVTCDASLDAVGFCASDTELVFCAEGAWWSLDCAALDASAFCGVDDAAMLDCWAAP